MRTVSELADLAGVTVRTLHHYDEIGLLSPSARSAAGYRLYDRSDLQRLQQIMFWRALGFTLAEIAEALDDPEFDRVAALQDQRGLLAQQLGRLTDIIKAVDEAIAEAEGGPAVDEMDMFEQFNTGEYAEEARQRWGDTDAWHQSQARAATWTDEDRRRIMQDGIDFAKRLADAFTAGVPADSAQAMDLAEQARLAIHDQFYDCSHEMHVQLGEMYVADPRFTRYYDQHAPGLAEWFRDAIRSNAER